MTNGRELTQIQRYQGQSEPVTYGRELTQIQRYQDQSEPVTNGRGRLIAEDVLYIIKHSKIFVHYALYISLCL